MLNRLLSRFGHCTHRFAKAFTRRSASSIAFDEIKVCSLDKRGRVLWQICWDEVIRICAYKVDAYVVDQIVIGLMVDCETGYYCCTEDLIGWDKLNAELGRRYGVKMDDWWPGVAFPPMVENFTVLWER